jgi:hypothetical protein
VSSSTRRTRLALGIRIPYEWYGRATLPGFRPVVYVGDHGSIAKIEPAKG